MSESNNFFDAKKERRKLLAQLPIEEKIQKIIKLQEIVLKTNPKLKEKGLAVWKKVNL